MELNIEEFIKQRDVLMEVISSSSAGEAQTQLYRLMDNLTQIIDVAQGNDMGVVIITTTPNHKGETNDTR